MELIRKDLILKEIPLFSTLSQEEQTLVQGRSILRHYKKGDIIYREGSPADAFYCIILGRVIIYTQDQYGNETLLEYLHRGKYFGIISLLTGEPHSVTAKAINDCLILSINKEDFDFILNKIPKLAIDLSQTLSRRLKRKDIHQKTIFESTVISIFSSYSKTGKTVYALNLALSLNRETRKTVLILDIVPQDKTHSLPHRLGIEGDYPILDISQGVRPQSERQGDATKLSFYSADAAKRVKSFILENKFGIDLICIHYNPDEDSSIMSLVDITGMLVNDYHYIILDLPSSMDRCVFAILNQSDSVHILTSPEPIDLERTRNLIERLKIDLKFQESKIKTIINEYKFAKITHEQQLGLLGHTIFATLPKIEFSSSDRLVLDEPTGEYARAVRRVSRNLGDRMVGLALGVGVAYGFCHIGVLKVIEEEKIPIDVIAGSSIGALIASLWVTGRSSDEILEIAKEFREPKYIWSMIDFTFPWLGFIKGNKIYNFLNKYLGNKTFYDVKLPLKIIASDVKRKETKVLDKGLLVDAIMASCTMPGVFIPFKFKEEMLFDGGVIHPLPIEPLFKMGVKKIIAVNVTPSREDIIRQYEKIKEEITLLPEAIKRRKWFSLKQYFRDRFKANILDFVFSSIEILQSEVARKEAQLADIVLHPDTQGLFWLELHKAEVFAKRGEEETRRQLDKIWQIINE
jgi:NTE family protein